MAKLVRASDQNSEDPGLNPGWISMSDLSCNSANETPFNYWYPTTRHRKNFNGSIKNHNCSICMYKHYDYFTNFLVHVINIRVPDGGSTDTARESGSA